MTSFIQEGKDKGNWWLIHVVLEFDTNLNGLTFFPRQTQCINISINVQYTLYVYKVVVKTRMQEHEKIHMVIDILEADCL